MPITQSAKKALRQNRQRRVFNLRHQRTMKSLIKQIKKLITENKKEEAQKLLPETFKTIDKTAKKGIIKKNNASRKKSRLSKSLNKI